MTLAAQQLVELRAPYIDRETRYFSGPAFKTLVQAGLTDALAAWTAPDTGKPGTWTEITDYVARQGSFTRKLTGSALTWDATLTGHSYDRATLGVGVAVVCWARRWEPAGGWQAWEREYVGQFLSADGRDNYQQGQAWTRRVEGIESYLRRINASYLAAGLTRVTDGATVTVRDSNYLIEPELERDTGEFLGGVANCEGDNIVDGRLESVFISQYVPGVPAPPEAEGLYGDVVISEVFIRPPTGYDTDKAWWIELYNGRYEGGIEPTIYCASWVGPGAGDYAPVQTLTIDKEILPRRFAVVCGDKALYEELTGGGHRNACWVVDATEQFADFTLHFTPHQTDGMICTGTNLSSRFCVYAPAGATRTYGAFSGAAFNSTLLATGDSIERDMSTYDDGNNGSERYAVNSYPVPGEYKLHYSGEHPGVALKVELRENVHTLTQTIGTASTSVPLNNALGFDRAGGTAICNADTFAYTGLSGNTLTGVSGVSATHNMGEQVYPYVDNVAQTGYPLYALTLRRRKAPYVAQAEIYWSAAADAAMYHEPGWTTDYYPIIHVIAGNNAPDYRVVLAKRSGTYAGVWVRTILLVINRMTDDGRAKLNELDCELEIAYTGTDYARSQPGDLARLLLLNQAGMVTTDIADATAYAHPTGYFATAIRPVPEVLNDLAKRSGCLVDYNPDGKVYMRDDPHWPGVSRRPIHDLTAADWRGELAYTDDETTCDWVIINGTTQTPSGPQAWRKIWPQPIAPATEPDPGKQGVELDGYVTASAQDGLYLAYAEWERRQGPGKLQVTATGCAPWAAPGQIIGITHAFGLGAGYVSYRRYCITQLTRAITAGALAYNIEAERLWY